jgi:hypothetical protein
VPDRSTHFADAMIIAEPSETDSASVLPPLYFLIIRCSGPREKEIALTSRTSFSEFESNDLKTTVDYARQSRVSGRNGDWITNLRKPCDRVGRMG